MKWEIFNTLFYWTFTFPFHCLISLAAGWFFAKSRYLKKENDLLRNKEEMAKRSYKEDKMGNWIIHE